MLHRLGAMPCMAVSWFCAASSSKGSTGKHLDPGSRWRWHEDHRRGPTVGREGQSLDELLVGHHPIVGRRQQPINALQAEGPMERDGLFGRPHGHAGDLLQMHWRAAAPINKGQTRRVWFRGKPMKLAFTPAE